MSDYTILLSLLKQNIEDDDTESLEKNIMLIPLNKLTQDTLDVLLLSLINSCVEFNNTSSIKTIFKIFYDLFDIDIGQLDHLTRFFCSEQVPYQTMLIVANVYKEDKPL